MPTPPWWRRVRRHFASTDAQAAQRSTLPPPWRAVLVVLALFVVAGMWWWGFDFGQLLGGFNRKQVEARMAVVESELTALRSDAAAARSRASELESELAMARGAQATLTRQTRELSNENAQLKEELVFLQKLVAESGRQPGLSIERLSADRPRDDTVHYSLIVVRGGSPTGDFEGRVVLQAVVHSPAQERPATLTLPDDQPDVGDNLKLRFRYYQRLEGAFLVPPGSAVRMLTARAYESGEPSPRAVRSLTLP